MRTYASSRVKRKSFHRKSELQMFLFDFRPPYCCTKPKLHITKVRETLSQITQKLWATKDLRLGKTVYILVVYNISFSWLLPLDGFQLFFLPCLLRDSGNDLLVTKKFLNKDNNQSFLQYSVLHKFEPKGLIESTRHSYWYLQSVKDSGNSTFLRKGQLC